MRVTLAMGLGLLLAANGFLMLLDPAQWYAIVPGVPETGPLNPHFVRDIGAAYVVTGVAIGWLARDARAVPAALAGALCTPSFTSPTRSQGGSTRARSLATWSRCSRRQCSRSGWSCRPPLSQGEIPCSVG